MYKRKGMDMQTKHRIDPLRGLALFMGMLCFLFVFIIPFQIQGEQFPYSDFVLVLLTVASFSVALSGLIRRPAKTGVLRIALALSLSLPLFWLLVVLWVLGVAFGVIG